MEKTLNGRVVLISLLGFFGLIIGMNILMAWFALDTFDGQVEENAYRGGLQFNERIANARSQEASGWSANVVVLGGARSVQVQLMQGSRAALAGARVEGLLWRQSVQGMDVPLAFEETRPGQYHATIPKGVHGRYELRFSAQRAGREVAFKQDIEFANPSNQKVAG